MNAITELILGARMGMSFADYLAVPAMSNSSLKLMRKSPAHYMAGQDPDAQKVASLRRGSLLHTMVLEPHTLAERYRVKPEGMTFSTKEGKAWREAVPASVEIVSHDEHKASTRQAAKLRAVPEIAELLSAGQSEVSFFWIDPLTGVHCKGRADWVFRTPSGVILLDLKTTECADKQAFAKSCARYCYHMQAAWYSDGWREATGDDVLGFVFGAVESAWPHIAAPYMLDDEAMDKGRAECCQLLNLYAQCVATDKWPGYVESIESITLPAWA
jgi:exodeoxyribonuclease VIII